MQAVELTPPSKVRHTPFSWAKMLGGFCPQIVYERLGGKQNAQVTRSEFDLLLARDEGGRYPLISDPRSKRTRREGGG